MKFYHYLTEKVSRKEIDDALKNQNVMVGAEFEFLLDDSIVNQIERDKEDNYQPSIDYDNEMDDYNYKKREWEDDLEDYRTKIRNKYSEEYLNNDEELENLIDKLLIEWQDENPEPDEPAMPFDYVSSWNRANTHIEYSDIEEYIKSFMVRHKKLRNYTTDDGWDFTEDSSLGNNGIELISPPMPINQFLTACEDIFNMINDIGYTDNDCGLHIGVSLKSGMDDVDPVKLMLFTDEEYIYKYFDSRKDNYYVKSVKKIIREKIIDIKKLDKLKNVPINTVKDLVQSKNIQISDISDHYNGVNTSHLEEENQYIEFRYMGGRGYNEKFEIVKKVIGTYIYNLKLARDRNFKKNEYISKCNRILLKIETVTLMIELDRLEDMLTRQSGLMITEIEGKIKKIKKLLINYPKITKMEFKTYANLLGDHIKYNETI
jgi:hypothetical protein